MIRIFLFCLNIFLHHFGAGLICLLYCVIGADVVMRHTGAASLPFKRFIYVETIKRAKKEELMMHKWCHNFSMKLYYFLISTT